MKEREGVIDEDGRGKMINGINDGSGRVADSRMTNGYTEDNHQLRRALLSSSATDMHSFLASSKLMSLHLVLM